MKLLLLLILLLTINVAHAMHMVQDIETGIQPYPCHIAQTTKNYFYIIGTRFGTAASAFVIELIALDIVHKSSMNINDTLPTTAYLLAAFTASLLGGLLGPRVYKILQHEPQSNDSYEN